MNNTFFFIRPQRIAARIRSTSLPRRQLRESKHHLNAPDHFIELIVAKLGMRFAEIGPGVNVVEHQLDRVAVDVVVEPAGNGVDAVVTPLTGIKILESHCRLEFFRYNEIAPLNVPAARIEVCEPGCDTAHG